MFSAMKEVKTKVWKEVIIRAKKTERKKKRKGQSVRLNLKLECTLI